ncbi:tRNA-dependent cyclodipeptide synthase [Sulfurimonas sp.]|uniref:tRNA-dependent cyclodipeptide synthase n=1 Tax=Sulfurimonas sp. TaxID=2022749 RepID=UPI0025CC6FCF|nr:tRNA-dependent cyclodipeptide synthase [Sulfurimonas sp.]
MPIEKIYSYEKEDKAMSLYLKKNVGLISSCKIYKEKELAFIGISLGNSYYTEDRLKLILSGFSSIFKNVAVLLADDLSIHNYRAIGYTEEKANKKLKKEMKSTRSRILKTIKYVEEKSNKTNIKFYQWKDVEQSLAYSKAFKSVEEKYNNDENFLHGVQKLTLNVLKKYTSDTQEEFVIDEGKYYILKELAFGLCASEFFKSSVLSCSYSDFPIYRDLLLSDSQIDRHETLTYECVEH